MSFVLVSIIFGCNFSRAASPLFASSSFYSGLSVAPEWLRHGGAEMKENHLRIEPLCPSSSALLAGWAQVFLGMSMFSRTLQQRIWQSQTDPWNDEI
jgi:hypothetical protein